MAENTFQTTEDKREQFDIGMSDEQLLNRITLWERESDDFWSVLKQIWIQNIEYYKGIQTGVERIAGKQSRAVENRIFMAIETGIPIATSRLPDIVVRSGSEDEQSQMDAQDLQDILGFHMERIKIQALAERFLRDMFIKRYGVFKIVWDKERDTVGLDVIDPRRIRIPRFGKKMEDLAFVMEDLEMSYGKALEFFGEEVIKELLKVSPIGESTSQEGLVTTVGTEEGLRKVRKATFSIKEIWTNEFTVWKAGNMILKKQPNAHFDFENDNKNFFDVPRKPYVIKSLFETEESIIGDTDYVQQVIPIQDNINTKQRQLENISSKASNPILFIDSDVMSEEEAANITNEPGFIIYGKDAANEGKIRMGVPGVVPNQLFAELQASRNEFDNIWGVHSTTRGEREGRETLGGRRLLRQADLGRIDLVSRQLERGLDEIAEYWTQLIKLFSTEEKTFSILGEDGVRFIENFSGAKIEKGVKPQVKTGSTLPRDEILIHEEGRLLWQMQAIGIKTLYKMLKLPNMKEAIEDYIATHSGAMLKQGAQEGGTTIPPEEVAPEEQVTIP